MACVLRLFWLGHQSLWIDEALTWLSAAIGQRLAPADVIENVHGPLYALVLHAWGAVAGDSEWALRLPSAVFGILEVPALAWLAGRWLGRETVAPAAWLAAGSPFLVWYSQEARNYSMLMLTTTLAVGLVLGLRDRVTPRAALAWTAAAVAGALSNLSFLLTAPVQIAGWLAPGAAARRRRIAFAAVLGVVALALLPWAPSVARTWDWRRLSPAHAGAGEEPLRGATTFHAVAVPFAFYSFAAGYTLGPSLRELRGDSPAAAVRRHALPVAAAAIVFGALGVLGLAALARRGRLAAFLLWVGPPFLVVSYFALQNFKVFHPRYLAVTFPAFLLALAAALADLAPRRRAAFAAAIGALWLISLAHHFFDPRYGKEDYRGALALVRAGAASGDVVVAVGADHPVVYYNRGSLPVRTLWLGAARRSEWLDRDVDTARARASAAWFVLSRGEDLDPAGAFPRRMGERFPGSERGRFEGVRVWRVAGDAAAP